MMAIIWKPAYMETAQRSKSQRPLTFFGSDRSDHMETSLYNREFKQPRRRRQRQREKTIGFNEQNNGSACAFYIL